MLNPFGLPFNFIDGSVPVDRRAAIVNSSRALLMTPDVVHAWLMGRLNDRSVRSFLNGLNLSARVGDETHVVRRRLWHKYGLSAAEVAGRLGALSARLQHGNCRRC